MGSVGFPQPVVPVAASVADWRREMGVERSLLLSCRVFSYAGDSYSWGIGSMATDAVTYPISPAAGAGGLAWAASVGVQSIAGMGSATTMDGGKSAQERLAARAPEMEL